MGGTVGVLIVPGTFDIHSIPLFVIRNLCFTQFLLPRVWPVSLQLRCNSSDVLRALETLDSHESIISLDPQLPIQAFVCTP